MRLSTALSLTTLLILSAPALGQDDDPWRLGESLEELTERERKDLERLPSELSSLPQDVLEAFLDEEVEHIESLAEDEIDGFVAQAKARFQAHGARHLLDTLQILLEDLGVRSKRVLAVVYKEELKRLEGMPDRLFESALNEAFERVIAKRLRRFKHVKLDVIKFNESLNEEGPGWSWKQGERGDLGEASRLVSDLVVLAKEDSFVKTLFEREIRSDFGVLSLTGAKLEGLAAAKVGKLSITDEFGRVHEGLGATFKVKTSFTVAEIDAESERLELLKDGPISVSTMLLAKVVDATTKAEVNSTNLVTRDGLILHNELEAGATISTRVRVPIDIDLSIFKVRITPYAEAHAGAGASARANIEIEWSGRFSIDVGAATSLGLGFGAGIQLEILAGPMIEKLLERVRRALISTFRPIFDEFRGIHEGGSAFESGKTTFDLDDLRARFGDEPRDELAAGASHEDVARRYAPVIYQRVKHKPHDFIRKVDFDGDFKGDNNWENSGRGDTKAHVYWELSETETHYFIHYTWYYARRESRALLFFRYAARHENDFGGVTLVVRKGAPRYQEVEMFFSGDDAGMNAYAPKGGDRWEDVRSRGVSMDHSGSLRFVDEVDHPYFDHERTHIQVFADARDHHIKGYNGRDDRDGFEGENGVVYYHTGTAEAPEGARDLMVGYSLLPLQELWGRSRSEELWTKSRMTVGRWSLPTAMTSSVGIGAQGQPIWAWSHSERAPNTGPRDRDNERVEIIAPGELFADPAKVVARLFEVREPFSRKYLHNRPQLITSVGAAGALRDR